MPTIVRVVRSNVTLAWDAVGGADSYWLSLGTELGGSSIFDADLHATALSLNLLLAAGSYYWRVYGMAAGVKGDPSDEGFIAVP